MFTPPPPPTPGVYPWTDAALDQGLLVLITKVWNARAAQAGSQAGQHLSAMDDFFRDTALSAGFGAHEVFFRQAARVPGFFRATKDWDIVVKRKGVVVAAIEYKSMDSKYSSNVNNRAEEAVGSAVDLRQAAAQGTLGGMTPWLGYVFLIRHDDESSSAVNVRGLIPAAEPIFSDKSYIERLAILAARLVSQQVYNAASVIAVVMTQPNGNVVQSFYEPNLALTFKNLAKGFFDHLAAVNTAFPA